MMSRPIVLVGRTVLEPTSPGCPLDLPAFQPFLSQLNRPFHIEYTYIHAIATYE